MNTMHEHPGPRSARSAILLLLLLPSLALTSPSCGGSQARGQNQARETADTAAASALDSLRHWLGKRPSEVDLWAYPPLRERLLALLGQADYEEFTAYMQEAMPIEATDGLLYTVGVVPDDAVRGVAYLIVMPEADRLRAFGVFGDYRIEAQSPGPEIPIPEPVQKRVEGVLNLEL